MVIRTEGVESLSYEELQQACRERGMRGMLSKQALVKQLSSWLSLSLDKNLPVSLLLLSRAFTYSASVDPTHLRSVISSLSSDAVDEVEQRFQERETLHSLDLRAIRDTLKSASVENMERETESDRKLRQVKEGISTLSSLISIEKEKITMEDLRASQSDKPLSETSEDVSEREKKDRERFLAGRLRGKVLSLLQKIEAKLTISDKESAQMKENLVKKIPPVLDRNDDNFISVSELRLAMEDMGIEVNEEELDHLWRYLDKEGTGNITMETLLDFVDKEMPQSVDNEISTVKKTERNQGS